MRWACCSFERPRLKTSTSTRLHPVAGNDRPCSPEGMARRPAGAGKGCTAYVPFHSRDNACWACPDRRNQGLTAGGSSTLPGERAIGRAVGWERVGTYVEDSGGAGTLKTKKCKQTQ